MSTENIGKFEKENLIPIDPFLTPPIWLGMKIYDFFYNSKDAGASGRPQSGNISEKAPSTELPPVEKDLENPWLENPAD
ncbi:MAG: hypothetical protein IPG59_03185 [Candidatus Melainabacteria bacterium]|nr:MAG: hypothetical protein IPG59_03185 [Candidatus Melainabacteria bacterium]